MDKIITFIISSILAIGGFASGNADDTSAVSLEGKSAVFVGDSISYGTNYYGGYGKLIGERYGMTVANTSRGGATVASGVPWSADSDGLRPCIYDLLADASGEVYDYVILEGGVNDFWANVSLGEMTDGYGSEFDRTSYAGALEALLNFAKTEFPDSKIGYVIIHDPFTYDAETDFEKYYEMTKAICDKWGVPYLDLYARNNRNTGVNVRDAETRRIYFGSESAPDGDGCHPNEYGYQKIYVEPMAEWMKSL